MNDVARQNALVQAHQKVESDIELWHTSDSENSLVEFLGWSSDEYKMYLEQNQLPERVVEEFLLA